MSTEQIGHTKLGGRLSISHKPVDVILASLYVVLAEHPQGLGATRPQNALWTPMYLLFCLI